MRVNVGEVEGLGGEFNALTGGAGNEGVGNTGMNDGKIAGGEIDGRF